MTGPDNPNPPHIDPHQSQPEQQLREAQLWGVDSLEDLGLGSQIEALKQRVGLHSELADAYRLGHASLYRTGLSGFDNIWHAKLNDAKGETLKSYGLTFSSLEDPRKLVSMITGHLGGKGLLRASWDSPAAAQFALAAYGTKHGLRDQPVIGSAWACLRVLYAPQFDEMGFMVVHPTDHALISDIFPDWNRQDLVPIPLLSQRLHQRQIVDVGQAATDARVDNFLKLLQVELGTVWLGDLIDLWTLQGTMQKKAEEFFSIGKQRLLDNNGVETKLAMLQMLVASLAKTAPRLPEVGKQVLEVMLTYNRKTIEEVQSTLQSLKDLYQQLNLTMPPSLQGKVEAAETRAGAAHIAVAAGNVAVEEAAVVKPAPPDPKRVAALGKRSAELAQEITAKYTSWAIPIRKQPPDVIAAFEALKDLSGLSDAVGQIWPGMHRKPAEALAVTLAYLDTLSSRKNMQTGREQLAEDQAAQEALIAKLATLQHDRLELGANLALPTLPDGLSLKAQVKDIKDHWELYVRAFRVLWPLKANDIAASIANLLEIPGS